MTGDPGVSTCVQQKKPPCPSGTCRGDRLADAGQQERGHYGSIQASRAEQKYRSPCEHLMLQVMPQCLPIGANFSSQ